MNLKNEANSADRLYKAFIYIVLGILAVLKYSGFVTSNLNVLFAKFGVGTELPVFRFLLPLGISFYTFQSMGYLIDVYWEKVTAEKNIARFALFVSFFPQLVAGPIERSKNLLHLMLRPPWLQVIHRIPHMIH